MYIRAFITYKSVVMYSYISEHSELTSQWLCTHVSQSSQNLQVSSYVLMYLRAVRTYKSVVMYSCISEHSELTSQWLCTHASLSIQNLQVSSYVLVYLRAYRTYKSVGGDQRRLSERPGGRGRAERASPAVLHHLGQFWLALG